MNAFHNFFDTILQSGLEFFGLYYGTYQGVVEDSDDPDGRGRIKVRCAEVWGKAKVDQWVFPKGIMAGKKTGFHFPPQKGDTIWITFRGGKPDAEYALWEYGWWTKDNQIEGAEKDVYILATPKGHTWVIDEKNNVIYFQYKNGKSIGIKEDKVHIGTYNGAAEPAVLGDKNETALKELAAKVDVIFQAITAGVPSVVPDGGAALKSSILAYMSANGLPMTPAFNTTAAQTKSTKVTTD